MGWGIDGKSHEKTQTFFFQVAYVSQSVTDCLYVPFSHRAAVQGDPYILSEPSVHKRAH